MYLNANTKQVRHDLGYAEVTCVVYTSLKEVKYVTTPSTQLRLTRLTKNNMPEKYLLLLWL
jgi:hypothetical protein